MMKTAWVLSLLLSVLGGIPTAWAEETWRLRLSHYLPETHGLHREFLQPFAERVARLSRGRLQIDIYPGHTRFGHITRQADQVRKGIVDMALGLNGVPRNRYPATNVMEMPFLVKRAEVASRALWALYQQGALASDYAGFKVLALVAHSGAVIHTQSQAVKTLDDLQGLRLRTPSVALSKTLNALGIETISMAPTSIRTALSRGQIDGVLSTWDLVDSFGLGDLLTHHTEAYTHVAVFHLLMNQRRYAVLPQSLQQAIDEASGEVLVAKMGRLWARWEARGRSAAQHAGHQIHVLDARERQHWARLTARAVEEYVASLQARGVDDPLHLYHQAKAQVQRLAATADSETAE